MMELFPYICVFGLVVFVVVTVWLADKQESSYDPYKGMSDQQIRAVDNQIKVIFCMISIMIGIAIMFFVAMQLFPGNEERVKPFVNELIFILMIGSFGYIGLSSILYRASMLAARYLIIFPKEWSAVLIGIVILMLIGLALYVAWVKLTGM